MTNYEFYKDKIEEIEKYNKVAIKDNKPTKCEHIDCYECQRDTKSACSVVKFMEWAMEEHETINLPEDIEVDTPILVSNDGIGWAKRYFAERTSSYVRTFSFGATSWSTSELSAWKYAKLPEEEQKNE